MSSGIAMVIDLIDNHHVYHHGIASLTIQRVTKSRRKSMQSSLGDF